MYHYRECYFFVDTTNNTIYALRRFSKYHQFHDNILINNLINKCSKQSIVDDLKDSKKSFATLKKIKEDFSNNFNRNYLKYIDSPVLCYKLETSPGNNGDLYTIDFQLRNNGIHRDFVHTGFNAIEIQPKFPVFKSQNREIQITKEHLNKIAQSNLNNIGVHELLRTTSNTFENQNALAHEILVYSGTILTATEEQ